MTIRFDSVSKAFGPKRVLEDVSFETGSGEILFVIGRSGMGKSVTLKHIVGILKPDRGKVVVDGDDITRFDELELARVRRKCGMVFQHPALLDSLTVFENVAFGLRSPQYASSRPKPPTEKEIRSRVLKTLSYVDLGPEILERMPPDISYGMQKRVSLARTLAPGPRYLLFDEPTTGLDPVTTQAVNDLICDLSRKLGVTSLVVSHDMESALALADRILVLDQGRILALGTPDEIKRSEAPLIRDFLAEAIGTRRHPERCP